MKYLLIYFKMMKLRIKSAGQYKVDFLIGISGLLVQQLVTILLIYVVFNSVSSLNGYSMAEILLIYGLSQLIRGLDMGYNDHIWQEAWIGFSEGSLYQYMTKPLPIYLQILTMKFNSQSLGSIVIGSLALYYGFIGMMIEFSIINILVLLSFIVFGLIMMFSIKLITASFALFLGKSGEIMELVHEFVELVKFPINVYAFALQTLLIIIVPFAALSFIPSFFWIEHQSIFNLPLFSQLENYFTQQQWVYTYLIITSTVFFIVSQILWKVGLKYSNNTGT